MNNWDINLKNWIRDHLATSMFHVFLFIRMNTPSIFFDTEGYILDSQDTWEIVKSILRNKWSPQISKYWSVKIAKQLDNEARWWLYFAWS